MQVALKGRQDKARERFRQTQGKAPSEMAALDDPVEGLEWNTEDDSTEVECREDKKVPVFLTWLVLDAKHNI